MGIPKSPGHGRESLGRPSLRRAVPARDQQQHRPAGVLAEDPVGGEAIGVPELERGPEPDGLRARRRPRLLPQGEGDDAVVVHDRRHRGLGGDGRRWRHPVAQQHAPPAGGCAHPDAAARERRGDRTSRTVGQQHHGLGVGPPDHRGGAKGTGRALAVDRHHRVDRVAATQHRVHPGRHDRRDAGVGRGAAKSVQGGGGHHDVAEPGGHQHHDASGAGSDGRWPRGRGGRAGIA
jgi:hypothetical protein